MKKATIQLEDLACPSCVQKIEAAVKKTEGLEKDSINILFNSSKVKFNFDEEKISVEDVEKVIRRLGFKVKKTKVQSL